MKKCSMILILAVFVWVPATVCGADDDTKQKAQTPGSWTKDAPVPASVLQSTRLHNSCLRISVNESLSISPRAWRKRR